MFFLPFFFINKNSRENSFKKRAVRGKKTEWKIGCGTHMRGRCWRKFFIGGFLLWRWNSGNDGTSIRCIDWWISDCTSIMQIIKRYCRNFRPKVFIQAEKKSFQSARYETGKWKMLRLSIDGWGRRKVRLSWRRLRVQPTSWVDQTENPMQPDVFNQEGAGLCRCQSIVTSEIYEWNAKIFRWSLNFHPRAIASRPREKNFFSPQRRKYFFWGKSS